MVSKALVVGAYQRKLEEMARQPGLELTCIVPPAWRQDGRDQPLERSYTQGYELLVEPIHWNGRFHLFHFPGLGRQLARLRPDIVHIDEEPYNLATFLATRLALRQAARPLFFTWQNILRRYPPPFRWLESYVLRHSAQAIAGNAEAAEVLKQKGYQGPIAVLPQFGVDAQQFSPAPVDRRSSRGARPFTIGYLGRLVEEKGLLVLLNALDGLVGDWRLVIHGHGPLLEPLVSRAGALGFKSRVAIHRPVSSNEVPGVLRGLDALVLPSLSRPNWKEQFGRVLIEAMACGVPVIGARSGEIPNVIGEAGLLFPEGAAGALRARLAELLSSERRRAELAARGRVRVLQHFTHEKIAAATCQVYHQMLAVDGTSVEARPFTLD